MKYLKVEKGLTYREIGEKYKLTRQRIEQIIGKELSMEERKASKKTKKRVGAFLSKFHRERERVKIERVIHKCPECGKKRLMVPSVAKATITCSFYCRDIRVLRKRGTRIAYRRKDWLKEKYIDKQMSINQIAKHLEVSVFVIHRWLKIHKIPRRARLKHNR